MPKQKCLICTYKIGWQRIVLPCKHIFHTKCLLTWTRHQVEENHAGTCPLCRRVYFEVSPPLPSSPPSSSYPFRFEEEFQTLIGRYDDMKRMMPVNDYHLPINLADEQSLCWSRPFSSLYYIRQQHIALESLSSLDYLRFRPLLSCFFSMMEYSLVLLWTILTWLMVFVPYLSSTGWCIISLLFTIMMKAYTTRTTLLDVMVNLLDRHIVIYYYILVISIRVGLIYVVHHV